MQRLTAPPSLSASSTLLVTITIIRQKSFKMFILFEFRVKTERQSHEGDRLNIKFKLIFAPFKIPMSGSKKHLPLTVLNRLDGHKDKKFLRASYDHP